MTALGDVAEDAAETVVVIVTPRAKVLAVDVREVAKMDASADAWAPAKVAVTTVVYGVVLADERNRAIQLFIATNQ